MGVSMMDNRPLIVKGSLSKTDWTMIVAVFLLSRLSIYFIGLMASRIYVGDSTVFDAFCQFDCTWYKQIIDIGYDLQPRWHVEHNAASWAFMPVYPMIAKVLDVFFNSITLSLFVVSNVSFFIALVFILKLSRQMGFSKEGYK